MCRVLSIIANWILIQVVLEFLLDHSKFLLYSGWREGEGSLIDSGQHYSFRYELDSDMVTDNKTNTPIC